jgi:PHS family inorganic phosphate transporter-like MFS transporter
MPSGSAPVLHEISGGGNAVFHNFNSTYSRAAFFVRRSVRPECMLQEHILHSSSSRQNIALTLFIDDFAHIQDPNERRRLALAEIDKAPFGWYYVRACLALGAGFFIEGYNGFAVGLLTTMLGVVYFPGKDGMPAGSDTSIKVALAAGSVVGQLGFGVLADLIGRARMYGWETIIIIIATLAQCLTSNSLSIDMVGVIVFCRIIVGIG